MLKSTSLPQVTSVLGDMVECLTNKLTKQLPCTLCSGIAITDSNGLSEEGILYTSSSQRDQPHFELKFLIRVLNKYLKITRPDMSLIQNNGEGGDILLYRSMCICVARKEASGFMLFLAFGFAAE